MENEWIISAGQLRGKESAVSLSFLRFFSSPETGDNIREISGDRIGDQFHPSKPFQALISTQILAS